MKNFRIIENPSELGAGTRGSSLGIEALRIAAINNKSRLFYDNEVSTLIKNNKKLFKDIDTPHAIRLKQILKRITLLGNEVADTLNEKKFPLVISGDHSSAAGTIAGLKKAYPNDRIGVIWIDAHSDMHTPYTTPSGNVHGMPLAMSLALDNKTHARNNVVDKTLEYWESCKNLFNISPKMDARDLVFIGLRSSEKEEVALIEENSIKKILVDEVRANGCEPVIETTLDYLGECDSIYISLDVDSMDPDITSYGTGTPVKNGLLPEEVITLVSEFLKDNRIKVLELCEINPLLDDKNKMAELSLNILEKIIKIINKG